MIVAGWVLVFEDGQMFRLTEHHKHFVKTTNIQLVVLFKSKNDAQKVKETYKTFLANSKPMKLSYILEEE